MSPAAGGGVRGPVTALLCYPFDSAKKVYVPSVAEWI